MDFKDIRDDFISDVYNTLDFLPTNNEANRIIDSFDRVIDDVIVIPKGATNGDMIKTMFPNISVYEHGSTYSVNNEYNFNSTWWDTPYKGGNEND